MRKLRSIDAVFFCVVSHLRGQWSVCHAIAAQLVRDTLSGGAARSQKTLEDAFSCFAISLFLQIDIDDLAILIDSAPQVVLLSTDFYEHFV